MLATVLKQDIKLTFNLFVGCTRETDTAWIGDPFQSCSDVDAIAKNVITVDDDIADVDTNAQLDTFVCGHCTVALVHTALNFERATRSLNDAGKLDQDAVAGPFDDAPPMFGNLWFPKFPPDCVDPRERAFSSAPISRL